MFVTKFEPTDLWLEQKEIEFNNLAQDDSDSLWKELSDFFKDTKLPIVNKYWYSYWRWYTILTWDRLNSLSEDEFILALKLQAPLAVINNDVVSKMMFYFHLKHTPNQIESLYERARSAFINSDIPINPENTNLTISNLVKEFKRVQNQKNSLELAGLKSEVKRSLFFKNKTLHYDKLFDQEQQELAVNRLFDAVDFFTSVQTKDIWEANYLYVNQLGVGEANTIIETIDLDKEVEEIESSLRGSEEKEAIEARKNAGHYKMLKGKIASVEPEVILKELSLFAEKYNDEQILALYYFNEKTGKFEWNEELLKSSES